MSMPGFTGEDSLHRSNRDNGVTGASGQVDMAVQSALIIPINICARFPWLCQPIPAINVSWLNCHSGSGYVLVRGSNFAANSGVQVDVGNCSGPFPVKTGSTTDANGSFTSWVSCDCSGSTTVNAIDSAGNTAQGSSAMPC